MGRRIANDGRQARFLSAALDNRGCFHYNDEGGHFMTERRMKREGNGKPMTAYAAELKHIGKEFGDITACEDVTLNLKKGMIHVLLGGCGAGKTTLGRILAGQCPWDRGEILLDGAPARLGSPRAAWDAGIALIGEECPEDMTGVDFTRLGRGGISRGAARRKTEEIIGRFSLPIDPEMRMDELLPGQRLFLSLVRALIRDSRLLIFDEPSRTLTPLEMEKMKEIWRALREEGKTVLHMTSWAEDARGADLCAVLRGGKILCEAAPQDDQIKFLEEKAGLERPKARKLDLFVGSVILEVRDLTVPGKWPGRSAVRKACFEARAGEILCLLGTRGAGQDEIVEALAGMIPGARGRVRLDGKDISGYTLKQRLACGVSFLPGPWQGYGAAQALSLKDNMTLRRYGAPAFQESGFRRGRTIRDWTENALDARRALPDAEVNRAFCALTEEEKRTALAIREADGEERVLLAAEPGRGLDERGTATVWNRLTAVRDSRRAVVAATSDIREALALGDRIAVIRRGEIAGEFDPSLTTDRELGLYMTEDRRKGTEEPFDEDE